MNSCLKCKQPRSIALKLLFLGKLSIPLYGRCAYILHTLGASHRYRRIYMFIFNYIGMLLLAYSALYCSFKSGQAYLSYQQLNESSQLSGAPEYQNLSRVWVSMMVWLGVGLLSFILVFKLAPL